MSATTLQELLTGCEETSLGQYSVKHDYMIEWYGEIVHHVYVDPDNSTVVDLGVGSNCDLVENVKLDDPDNDLFMYKLTQVF